MPRLPGPERKAQIAETALQILATQGPTRLTARHIGDAIGISDAAVFKHFEDKEAILEAAITRFEELLERDPPSKGLGPVERLRHFVVHRIRRVRERPEILSLVFNERIAEVAGEAGAQRVKSVIKRSMVTVRKAVREGQADGTLNADLPQDVVVWMVQGVMRGAARTPRSGDPEQLFDALLLAIGPPSPKR